MFIHHHGNYGILPQLVNRICYFGGQRERGRVVETVVEYLFCEDLIGMNYEYKDFHI